MTQVDGGQASHQADGMTMGGRRRKRMARRGGGGTERRPMPVGSPRSWVPALVGLLGLCFAPSASLLDAQEVPLSQNTRDAASPGHAESSAGHAREEPPPLPERSDLARVVAHPDRNELEIVIGPVELPAGTGHLRLPIQLVEIPVAGWLHGFEWEIRDAEGRELPDRLLHHVNLVDPDNRELFGPVPRRVMAAGRETSRERIPRLLGYPVEAGTRLLVVSMFANATDRDHPRAYLHVRLFYSAEDGRWIRPRTVYPFYLDVMGFVGPKSFPLPPGKATRAWEGSPAIDGRILGVGGHLHDYATALRLVDVTAGETLWEAEPERDERGRVIGVPTARYWWRGGIPIRKGHVYRIEVEYHNPTDRPAPDGAMGAIGGVVWASGDSEWPPLDRRHPDYVADLRNTLEEPFRSGGHGGHDHGGEDGAEGQGSAAHHHP